MMVRHPKFCLSAAALVSVHLAACGDSSSSVAGTPGATGGTSGSGGTGLTSGSGGTAGSAGSTSSSGGTGTSGGAVGSGGTSSSGGASSSGGSGGAGGPTFDEAKKWVDDYQAAHPGQAGDINAKTPAEIAADPAAQQLMSLCGPNERAVIPQLAWEYGGNDHAWINPGASALVYCVYIPVNPNSPNWQFDGLNPGHVIADVYVRFPDQNPCKSSQGADQVLACIGDMSNTEILVDTASLNDGTDVGLSLSTASTELKLVLPDGTKIHLLDNA